MTHVLNAPTRGGPFVALRPAPGTSGHVGGVQDKPRASLESARCCRQDICLSILNRDDFTEVNAVDQFGYTILSLAASNGMVSVCKAVLEHPEFTQVNSKDKWGATALHWAAASNLGAVCSAILEHPAFVEAHVVAFSFKFENQTALQVAEERGCSDAEQAIKKALTG